MKKIVIIGGGFGGLSAIAKLKKYAKNNTVHVTLIDKNNFSLFTPMLPEVVSGTVKPENIVFSLREICKKNKADYLPETVISINKAEQKVICTRQEIEYDYLIIAAGSETNFRGNQSAQENSLEYKGISDAIDLKYRVIQLMEKAAETNDKATRQQLLAIAIIGGGITGVELGCELQEFIEERIHKEYATIAPDEFSINVFEYGDTILPAIDPGQAAKAQQVLIKKGINIINHAMVKEILPESIKYVQDEVDCELNATTIVWTAGVKGQSFMQSLGLELSGDGRIPVNEDLRPKHMDVDNIYVIGDCSGYEFKGQLLPPVAPLAMQQGPIAVNNIIQHIHNKPATTFTYINFGYLVALGKNNSVVNLFGVKFRGRFAYFAWKLTYLYKIGMMKKQIAVFFDWILAHLFGHDATLIMRQENCVGCNSCIDKCPAGILKKVNNRVIKTDPSVCIRCETCLATCEHDVHRKVE